MKCYFCGGINPPNTTFCKRCGALLSEEPDDTQKRIPEKRDPLEVRYEEIENRIKESEFQEMLYGQKLTRKEFQDWYMSHIYSILTQWLVVIVFSYTFIMFFVTSIFSIDSGFLYDFFVVFGTICSFARYVYKVIKNGGTMRSKGSKAFSSVTFDDINFINTRYKYSPIFEFGRFSSLYIFFVFIWDFGEDLPVGFHIVVFLFMMILHRILFRKLGKAYDMKSESGTLPKWVEIVEML